MPTESPGRSIRLGVLGHGGRARHHVRAVGLVVQGHRAGCAGAGNTGVTSK